MSIYMMEKALLEIASSRLRAQAYRDDPDAFLDDYMLEPDEIRIIKEMDVLEMTRRSLNPMLTMRLFSAVEGRENMPEYLRRLKEEA